MKRTLTGQHNQCAACHEYFNSNAAFDKHRIGEFGLNRRCATVEEMRNKGMSLNATGWWVTEKMPQKWIPDSGSVENNRATGKMGTVGLSSGGLPK